MSIQERQSISASGADHKDRLIQQLKQEATELRQKERDYKALQD